MNSEHHGISSSLNEVIRATGSKITVLDRTRNNRRYFDILETRRPPDIWSPADAAFNHSGRFPGKVFTNRNVVIHGASRRADTIVFLLFDSSPEITIDMLVTAAHREARSSPFANPIVSRKGSSALIQGSYVSEGILLHSLTRYHLEDEGQTLSQITVTTASQSEVNPGTRDWLLGLDHPHEQKSFN